MKRLLKLLFLWLPATLLVLYALTGFWAIPALVEREGPALVKKSLGADATLGAMRFNPFTMRLAVDGFRLDDDEGRLLFGLQSMTIDFDLFATLWHRTLTFETIRFERPRLRVVVDGEGVFNFQGILEHISRAEKGASEAKGEAAGTAAALPPLKVVDFEIRDFTFHFEDRTRKNPLVVDTSPTSFTIRDFSTHPGAQSALAFEIRTKEGGRVGIAADFSLQPLRVRGQATVDTFSLARLNALLRPFTPLRVEEGEVGFRLDFSLGREGTAFRSRFTRGLFTLKNVRIADGGATPILLGNFTVEGVDIDPQTRRVTARSVGLDDSRIDLSADDEGVYSFERWFAAEPVKGARGPDDAKGRATKAAQALWRVEVARIHARSVRTRFQGPHYGYDAAYRAELSNLLFDTTGRLIVEIDLLETGDITLRERKGGSEPLRLRRLALEKGMLDTRKRRILFERAVVDEPAVTLVVREEGATNLDPLLRKLAARSAPQTPPSEKPAPAGRAEPPFDLVLERFDFQKGRLTFEDRRFRPAVAFTGDAVNLRVENLALPARGAVPLRFSMRLPGDASMQAHGTWHPREGTLALDAQAKHLALQPYQPILQQFLNVEVPTGVVDGRASVHHDPAATPKTTVTFDAALSNLSIINRANGQKLFGLEKVAIEEGRLELSPDALLIPRLVVDAPSFDIRIAKDRTSNLDGLFKPSVQADDANVTAGGEKGGATSAGKPRLDLLLAHLSLEGGRGRFADESLVIPFHTEIHAMEGDLIGLDNQEGNVAGARFHGVIGRYGVMRARSLFISSDPTRDTSVEVAFRNLDITKVSPYIGKYLGYEIADGRLWVKVTYHIENGRLASRNSIVFKRLKLGRPIESEEGVGGPVRLALNLLTDSEGNIDLDIPIEGNLTDPKVNLDGILLKALARVVTKVVEAPFKILGKMLGVSGAALQYVHFDPGLSLIEATEKETLDALAKALPQKSGLKLVIPGVYEQKADTRALKRAKLRDALVAKLQAQAKRPVKEAMRSGVLLEAILRERAGDGALRAFMKERGALRRSDPKKYLEALFEEALRTFEVGRKELENLAASRAEAVRDYLAGAGVPARQLATGGIKPVEKLDDTGMVALKLEMAEARTDKKR
ncbi:DUF748 domain-containing protein [Hydrogenimonas sp.]